MTEPTQDACTNHDAARAELRRMAFEGKLQAIRGYDEILWKIRVGYAAVLYGGLSLAFSKEVAGLPVADKWVVLYVTLLVIGFSVAAFVIDVGFQVKKLKVVVTRDALVRLWLIETDTGDEELKTLCQTTGEMAVAELPDCARRHFKPKMWSNLRWTLLPLYMPAPLGAVVTCVAIWVGSSGGRTVQ